MARRLEFQLPGKTVRGRMPLARLQPRPCPMSLRFLTFPALLGLLSLAMGGTSQPEAPPKLPEGAAGLAAQHPGDQGIASDPAVLFADDFEGHASPPDLGKRWDFVYHDDHMRLVRDPDNRHQGRQALECTVPRDTELSVAIGKKLAPQQDRLFLRFHLKFPKGFDVTGARSCHNGATISARYYRDGNATPGQRADGRNKFLVNFECESVYSGEGTPPPGKWNFYCYHPAQRDNYGDHIFPSGLVMPNTSLAADFGPSFVPRPELVPDLDRWYCAEFMVQANTPGQRDGRLAAWIDGKLLADHPNLRLRDIESLKIDHFGLGLYLSKANRIANTVCYDDVVVATRYIGPVAPAR